MITDDQPPDEGIYRDASSQLIDFRTPPRKLKAARRSDASEENWDDDFASNVSPRPSKIRSSFAGAEGLRDRLSFEKDSSPFRTPRRDLAEGLRAWSESPNSVRHRTPGLGPKQEENWDDDFAGENAGSPARSGSASVSKSAKKKRRQSEEVENWDDEFGIQTDPGSPRPTTTSKRLIQELAWESSDDESPGELGFNDRDDEEDKTVTSKHRRKPLAPLNRGDIPPLPPLSTGLPTIHAGGTPGTGTGTWSMPSSPFPRSSPNHSVFSIPATITTIGGRESTIADSTAHLALRRTHSAESSGSPHPQTFSTRYGPSSPPRERRRLRKKSRPPHLDSSILELDDKIAHESLAHPLRSSTPVHERPQTPPTHAQRPLSSAISSSTGGLLSPTTPSSALQSPPLSPSSKSPLLQRIGSMKKWGSGVRRMRVSTSVADPSSSQAPASALSPKYRSPPIAFNNESSERDRRDLNRTPRPHSYMAPSARPIGDAVMPTATPSTVTKSGRFFRSSSRDMERQRREASASRPSLHETLNIGVKCSIQVTPLVLSKAEKTERKDKEKLRVLVPRAIAPSLGATHSSQSGDSELGSSPRRARIRAFGQKLLAGSGVATGVSRTHSPDSAHGTNSSEGGDSRRSSLQYHSTPPPMSAPLVGEPSRLKPRLQGQGVGSTSSLRIKGVFPRHVSGSVLQEKEHQERKRQLRAKNPLPSGVHAPGFGVAGRSVSATTFGSNRTGSSENADHSGVESGSTNGHNHAGGHRYFMGSMRRISLTNRRSKTDDGRVFSAPGTGSGPGSGHSTPDRGGPKAPELPKMDLEVDSFSKHPKLLRLQSEAAKHEVNPRTKAHGGHIDLASPKSTSTPLDWGAPPPVPASAMNSRSSRKSVDGFPVLSHSKSSSFATGTASSSKTATIAATVVPGRGPAGGSLASQAASLSRASPLPVDTTDAHATGDQAQGSMHRRNSLGDLKIPSRISKAQDGLKRDLGRVREFASCVEQMQDLRSNYFSLASRIHEILEVATSTRPASRASITSPTSIFRSNSRQRSHTTSNATPYDRTGREHRLLAVGFQRIDAKYAVAWECADLLIELGTGSAAEPVSQAPTPPIPDQPLQNGQDSKQNGLINRTSSWRAKNRERAVTLAGDEGKPDLPSSVAGRNAPTPRSPNVNRPPPNVSWRASTGRHDFGHRQLYLLKEMLSNADTGLAGAHFDVNLPPELCELNEGLDSTLTLPTEESAVSASQGPGDGPFSPNRTKRPHKLGMIGFRDMLRSLKRKTTAGLIPQHQQRHSESQQPGQSTSTVNTHTTEASSIMDANGRRYDNHPYNYNTVAAIPVAPSNTRRKSETSAALQMHMHMGDQSFTSDAMVVSHKSSPRRPSLASLFRIGQKHKAGGTGFSTPDSKEQSRVRPGTADSSDAANRSGDLSSRSSLDDSDWDRMDSMSDLEHQRLATQAQNGLAPQPSGGETASTKTGTTVKLHRRKQSRDSKNDKRPGSPTFRLPFGGSQVSFTAAANASTTIAPSESMTNLNNFRSARLSNVDENADSMHPQSPPMPNSRGPTSRSSRDKENKLDRPFSSVRIVAHPSKKGMPSFSSPAPNPNDAPNVNALPDLKLAMTPENIKPLLDNAKVVTTRLVDCLSEVRTLLGRMEGGSVPSVTAGTECVAGAASASNANLAAS